MIINKMNVTYNNVLILKKAYAFSIMYKKKEKNKK